MEQNETNEQNTQDRTQFDDTINTGAVPPVAPVDSTMPAEPAVTPPVEQKVEKVEGEKKKNQAMMFALVICLLLAVGGVGFGIWAMFSGNERADELSAKVTTLQNQNAELTEQITKLNPESGDIDGTNGAGTTEDIENQASLEARYWASTEVRDGIFYVLDAEGNVIVQSNATGPVVNEIEACESSSDNTILTCTVNTTDGDGWFLYDVYGDSLGSSFDED